MIVPWILGVSSAHTSRAQHTTTHFPIFIQNEATPVYLDTLGSDRFQWAHNRLNVLPNGGALMDGYSLKTSEESRRLKDQEWKALWGGGFEKPMTSEEFKESVKSLPPSAFRPYSKFTNHNVIYGSSALVSPCLTKIALHRGEKMAVVSLQGGEIVERPDESANLRSLGFLRDWSPDGVFFLANVEAISSDIRQLSIWKTVPELSLEATVADQITTPRGSMAFRTDGMFLSNNTYITVQARQNSPSLIQLWELPTHESLRRWLVFNAWLTQLEAYRGTQVRLTYHNSLSFCFTLSLFLSLSRFLYLSISVFLFLFSFLPQRGVRLSSLFSTSRVSHSPSCLMIPPLLLGRFGYGVPNESRQRYLLLEHRLSSTAP